MTTWVCTRQGELCHHGIKGQKWGCSEISK